MKQVRPPVAERMERIAPFHVMALLARARELEAQGRDIVHLEIGEPDFVTPEPILKAGQQALVDGRTFYTPASGLPQLRQAVADYYWQRFAVKLDPRRVIITPGASGALLAALEVLINPGDEVLLTDPGYPCNRHFVELVHGTPKRLPVSSATDFFPTLQQVRAAWSPRARLLMLASPNNPTGTLAELDTLQAMAEQCRAGGGYLLLDEIYQGLEYGRTARTLLERTQDIFLINSFSKYFGMTGWRLGWLVAPEPYLEAIDRFAQNVFLAAPTLAQYAALAAFTPATRAILETRRLEFQARRDELLPALRELGFVIEGEPRGAFYLYADCSRRVSSSSHFAQVLLEQAGVAVTPGKDFGHEAPERFLRFAYTTSLPRLREGVERIKAFLHHYQPDQKARDLT